MDEQFYNKLKNRIGKVFENFEHPSADKGWRLLQEKLPELRKNRGINWLWAGFAAAVILLMCFGVNTLIMNRKDDTKRLSQKTIKHYDHENKIAIQKKETIGTPSASNHTAAIKNSIADAVLPQIHSKLMAKNQSSKNQTLLPKGINRSVVKTKSIKTVYAKTQIVKSDNEDFLLRLNKKRD